MDHAESIRRRLLTFALVRTNFAQSTDHIAALRPFFVPIANDFADQAFDPALFRLEMQKRYDLHLSRDVTELFVRRLTQLHYLQSTSDARKLVWKRQTDTTATDTHLEDAKHLDEIVEKARVLHGNRGDLLKAAFNEDDFLSGLVRLLLDSPQVQTAVGAVEGLTSGAVNTPTPQGPAKIRDSDHYFASEFVAWAKKHDQQVFDWVADLSGAAMVAEALIEIRAPAPNQHVRADLTAYLDAPVAMELLGVSGQAAQQDARAIVDGLREHNVIVSILSHSVEEIRSNLKAVLGKSPQQRTGQTALALLHGEIREQDVAEVLADVEYFLKNFGIQVVNPLRLSHTADPKFFSEQDQHSFFAAIQGHYKHIEAADRDAASVAWIMRRRKNDPSKDLLRSKYVLLTRNDLLYRTINRFSKDKGYVNSGDVGPVALVRDVAGILWIIGGSKERETLSKRQLLLNCQKARGGAPEIISSMYGTLKNVNVNSAELFWAAVQRPRYMSMALDAVASGGVPTSPELADDVLDAIREDLVAAERAKGRQALQRASEKYAQDTSLKEVVITSLERETDALKEQNAKHLAGWTRVSNREWALAVRAGARQVLLQAATIILLLCLAVGLAAYVGSDALSLNPVAEAIIVVAVAIALLFVSVGKVFERILVHVEALASKRYVDQIRSQVPDEHFDQVLKHGLLLPTNLVELFKAAHQTPSAAVSVGTPPT